MKVYRYEEFTTAIEKNIAIGVYKPGHKLPSVRSIMDTYKISIGTVQKGYEYLLIKGLIESIPKSGFYVSTQQQQTNPVVPTQKRPLVRDAVFKHHLDLTTSRNKSRHTLSEFNVAAPGDFLIPQKLLLRTMQQVIREEGMGLLRYYPSGGSVALKDNIVRHAAHHGTLLHADELIITDGALQALFIALNCVCTAGDVVAVESPCVFSILEVLRVLQLKVIEIPVDAHTGFDVDYLKKACTQTKIKALLITPNFHNPTGLLLSEEQKKHLLQIAQQYGVPVIENDIYGDLNFGEQRPGTIKTFDESGLVMTYSSYAKTLAPGIRLGWLSPGRYFQKAEQLKFSMGSTVSPVYQETVNKLITSTSYERHVRTFRMQLARNAYFTLNLIRTYFPANTRVITPAGGYHIWVQMPDTHQMDLFYKYCQQIGVRFTPGYTFSFSNTFGQYFRLVFADLYSESRETALKAAGQWPG